jgi:hypothetical protein
MIPRPSWPALVDARIVIIGGIFESRLLKDFLECQLCCEMSAHSMNSSTGRH